MTDYPRSKIETIRSLLQSIASHPEATFDVREFASSAEFQLRDLESHLKFEALDPTQFSKRRGDRGYMGPSVLPHMQTVMLNVEATAEDERARLSFNRADTVKAAPPIEERRKK